MNNKLNNTKSLLDLSLGESGQIQEININGQVKDRLYSLGLIEGIEIALVKDTPFNSPKVYKYLNTTIAMRTNVAKQINVKVTNKE